MIRAACFVVTTIGCAVFVAIALPILWVVRNPAHELVVDEEIDSDDPGTDLDEGW